MLNPFCRQSNRFVAFPMSNRCIDRTHIVGTRQDIPSTVPITTQRLVKTWDADTALEFLSDVAGLTPSQLEVFRSFKVSGADLIEMTCDELMSDPFCLLGFKARSLKRTLASYD